MEQNKVEILEALNNEKMYLLRGDEVGKMCSPEGNDICGDCRAFVLQKSADTILNMRAESGEEVKHQFQSLNVRLKGKYYCINKRIFFMYENFVRIKESMG